jgi:hypothetical protein
VAIDKTNAETLQYQELSFFMTSLRTAPRNETSDIIVYGETVLVALQLKAQRQLEVIAPDQQDNLLVLCRLIQIYTLSKQNSRMRYRLSMC